MVESPEKDHWWHDMSPEDQRHYLHEHPHSHKKQETSIPIDTKYQKYVAQVYNQFNKDDSHIHHYLDRHLTDEEKQQLEDVVNGKKGWGRSTHRVLKKVMLIAFSGAIIGCGLAISAPLLLACYAAFKVSGRDAARWLYDKIHNVGGNDYDAVDEAIKESYEFKPIDDEQLNEELDGYDEWLEKE